MAKKPPSGNYDVLGSIYDFMFEEAKKAPDKRRPIKPTGFAGDSALTNAIFASLEKPGVFISDEILSSFNDSLDMQLAVIKFGDPAGKFKVTTTGLIDVVKDPRAAFEKAMKKNEGIRRNMKATFLGELTKDFVATGWARKYADLEAYEALKTYGLTKNRRGIARDKIEIQFATQQARRNPAYAGEQSYVYDRAFLLLARKTFGEETWNNLSEAKKKEFQLLVDSNVSSSGGVYGKIENFLKDELGPNVGSQRFSVFKKYSDPTKVANYIALEKENIAGRISKLEKEGFGSDSDKVKMYKKVQLLLGNSPYVIKDNISKNRRGLKLLQRRINREKDANMRVQLSNEYSAVEEELEKSEKALKEITDNMDRSMSFQFGTERLFANIGRLEGYYHSLEDIHGGLLGTNVLASVLNGTFYDPTRNSLFTRPNNESSLKLGDLEIKFYVPKDDENNLVKRAYYEMGTNLYYMTPKSLFKTLFYNGEGFAYLLNKKLNSYSGAISILNKYYGSDYGGKIDGSNIIDFLTQNDLKDIIKRNAGNIGDLSKHISPQDLKKIKDLLENTKSLRRLTRIFSFPAHLQAKVAKIFNDRLKPIRQLIGDKILMKFFVKYGGDKLLAKWIAEGGLQYLIRGLTSAIVGAIGLAGTPVGAIAAYIISGFVTDVVLKITKELLVILKYVVLGIFALCFLIPLMLSSFSMGNFLNKNYTGARAIPGSVAICYNYIETPLEDGWDDEWTDTVVPPPSDEECPLGSQSIYCSQGFVDVQGWTHQNMKNRLPVDLTNVSYFYAPKFCNEGSCKITGVSTINCKDGSRAGGIVVFEATNAGTTYVFKLLHTKPLAPVGSSIKGGQPVAQIQDIPEVEKGWCWTGKHLHLEVTQNGASIDPLTLLKYFKCASPDESGCADP